MYPCINCWIFYHEIWHFIPLKMIQWCMQEFIQRVGIIKIPNKWSFYQYIIVFYLIECLVKLLETGITMCIILWQNLFSSLIMVECFLLLVSSYFSLSLELKYSWLMLFVSLLLIFFWFFFRVSDITWSIRFSWIIRGLSRR